MRSGAEGEHRTGEDAGRSRTLDATVSTEPMARGEVKGSARRTCPRSQSGKFGRGVQPKGGPKQRAEFSYSCCIRLP